MRKLNAILFIVFLTASLFAQAPQKISYQAVIRNINNQLLPNQVVGMRISILQGSITGTTVYVETQTPTTNANGLVSIEIGTGTIVTGTFSLIDWSAGPYFIKTETDPLGGTNYTTTGTSQLLSVPYALYASKAANGFSGIYNDLTNKPTLFDGTWLSLTGKPLFATVATSGSYADLSNKPTTDGSETKVTAGTNIAVAGTGTITNPYIVNSTSSGTGIPGTTTGDMQYWNGTAWVMVPVGQPGQFLQLTSSSVPFWSGAKYATITTLAVSSITGCTATGGGNLANDGGSLITANGVCWSTSANPTIADRNTSVGTLTQPFTCPITGLRALTTYYVRAYATNSAGTAYGNEISFTTTSASTPKLISYINTTPIDPELQISWTTASFAVDITSDGGANITANGVCWSTAPNPTIANSKTNDATETGYFTSLITGLSVFTTYYVRAYATNSVGITYGDEISFTTKELTLPSISTALPNPIAQTTATSGGNVLNDGGAAVSARGVCWNTLTNPTIANSKTTNNIGTGTFASSLTGLTANTTYYARAYATNSLGTAYGNEIKFTTYLGYVTDIEGTVYNTVSIGTQIWMAENLKTTKYNNTDLIGTTSLDITSEITPKYQWAYDENESNAATYGRLYTWYAVVDNRNMCPTGWHVPTDAEWTTLTTYLGGESVAGTKLKEAGTTHWHCESSSMGNCIHVNNGTNETGFTALPGGSRTSNRTFSGNGDYGYWWSSTEYSASAAWWRNMRYAAPRDQVGKGNGNKRDGLSVRCIQD
jgi:uncharacterized protein (TIGR02145 family)